MPCTRNTIDNCLSTCNFIIQIVGSIGTTKFAPFKCLIVQALTCRVLELILLIVYQPTTSLILQIIQIIGSIETTKF